MRIVAGAFATILMMSGLMMSGAALAAEAEGNITAINRDEATITLDDGKSYKLPGEFDMESIKEGMVVLLAYDEIAGVAQITDMDLSQ